MFRPDRLASLLSLALLGACAARPAVPDGVRPSAARPVCAVPPAGAAPARTGLDLAVAAGPPPEVAVASARLHRAAGDHAASAAWRERAAAAYPDDPEVCFELADLLVAGETELDRAGAMLLAIPAGHPRRDGGLGRLAELRGDPETAQAAYARQLAVADDPELRLRRALVLERLGRDAEAIAELERLRASDPGSVAARARLAERYEAAGRLEEAEAALRASAEASPLRPEGWRRLAAFCQRQGLAEKARVAEARASEAEARPRRELRPLRPTGR